MVRNTYTVGSIRDICTWQAREVLCQSGGVMSRVQDLVSHRQCLLASGVPYTGTRKVQHAGALRVARGGQTEGPAMQLWPATIASPSHEAYAHVATIIMCFHNRTQHLLWREGAGGLSVSSQRVYMRFFYTLTCLSLRLARGLPDEAGARDHPHGRACTRAVRQGGHQHA